MYVEVKELPGSIRDALKSIRYNKKDIQVETATEVPMATPSVGDGYRGFTMVVNIATGAHHIEHGSWGGANPFEHKPVESSKEVFKLPVNGVAIKGQQGGYGTLARIVAHPDAVSKLLPAPQDENLTDDDFFALKSYSMKAGEYRKDYLRSLRVKPETIDKLVEKGYLKRSSNGATQITTAGKNIKWPDDLYWREQERKGYKRPQEESFSGFSISTNWEGAKLDEAIRTDAFLHGYIQAALFSSTGDDDKPLDSKYTPSDISPRTFYGMRRDCDKFQKENRELLDQSGLDDERAGNLFWYDRNGHGTGFWDQDLGEIGEKLQAASDKFGSFDLYVGDDGKLHGSPYPEEIGSSKKLEEK